MLDVHQLQVFMVAAQTLNFSQAAKKLHMSQPSVTQHIQRLEDHFHAALFSRRKNQLKLTEAGKALLPLAIEMVNMSIRTDEIMQSLQGEVRGELILACTTTPGKYILAPLMGAFLNLHPRVTGTIKVMSRVHALQELMSGHVNLAVASVLEYSPDIDFQKLLTDRIELTVPLDHPWALRGEISPDELMDERFIMREETSGNYNSVRAGLAEIDINIESLKRVLTLGNSEAIAYAILEGVGVGFVSNMIYERLLVGRVAQVRVTGLEVNQDVTIMQSRRQLASTAQLAFWQYVHDRQPLESVLSTPEVQP